MQGGGQGWRNEFESGGGVNALEGVGVNTVKTIKFEKGVVGLLGVHDPSASILVPPLRGGFVSLYARNFNICVNHYITAFRWDSSPAASPTPLPQPSLPVPKPWHLVM